MADLRRQGVSVTAPAYEATIARIEAEHDRKVKQYSGEGATFFLIILVGAILVYRAVKKQLKISSEQQHFMMAITHELKTPIAVAKLNLETLQKRRLDEGQQQRLLHNTLQETNRLDSLCSNLLVSSQMESEGYKMMQDETDLSTLVSSAINDFRRRYPDRKIAESIAPDLFVSGDRMLLQIVANNLIENALKYSNRDALVSVKLERNNDLATFQVTDRGPGIAPAERKKVFEKFYRVGNEATRSARGTGLGLFLCKKIVIRHGGQIFIDDNPEGGSIFTVQLKAVD